MQLCIVDFCRFVPRKTICLKISTSRAANKWSCRCMITTQVSRLSRNIVHHFVQRPGMGDTTLRAALDWLNCSVISFHNSSIVQWAILQLLCSHAWKKTSRGILEIIKRYLLSKLMPLSECIKFIACRALEDFSVLRSNVGPEIFRNLCKFCANWVRNVSKDDYMTIKR